MSITAEILSAFPLVVSPSELANAAKCVGETLCQVRVKCCGTCCVSVAKS